MSVRRLRPADPDRSPKYTRTIGEWLSVVGAVASALGALGALLFFPNSKLSTRDSDLRQLIEKQRYEAASVRDRLNVSQAVLNDLHAELAKTKSEIKTLRSLVSIQATPGQNEDLTRLLSSTRRSMDDIAGELGQIKHRVDSTDRRLKALEVVIIDDPQKALALPLVKRDVEALQQQSRRDIESLRAENARSYDLMKWLIGLMALVSLSLIGTAAGHVFKREVTRELPKEVEKAGTRTDAAGGGAHS